jgi:MoaA/NifB/PqqE/SkfB family radical SAM enzyme
VATIHEGKRIFYQAEREVTERVLGRALGLLSSDPKKNTRYVLAALDRIAGSEKHAAIRNWVHNWLSEGNPGPEFLNRMLKNTNPRVRRRYIARMIVSMFFRNPEMDRYCLQEYGIVPPYTMLISPSMRCNYRCQGCYAASYERKDDMKPEVFDRLLGEAEHIGINFFTILGGEPFIYPELLDIIKRHNHSFFQIYTNSSFIDQDMAKKLAMMGNIAPQVSVNGPEEYTDASRGKGAFQKIVKAMDNLREAGCVFGFSTLLTRDNMDVILTDEWIDFLVEKGALYGWFFLYMPVGEDPDINLMPTPQQRDQLRVTLRDFLKTKPILMADFWNHGILTGGCIAGGNLYFHINHRGDVEPCIFCHFATNNINQCSLVEALASPFFKSIRENQPFGYNTLRPCPMIDHHQVMWSIIQKSGARPTHPGADKMFTALEPDLQQYSEGVRNIMDDAWEKEDYHNWVPEWTLMCGIPPAKLEARRQDYEKSRQGRQNANKVQE